MRKLGDGRFDLLLRIGRERAKRVPDQSRRRLAALEQECCGVCADRLGIEMRGGLAERFEKRAACEPDFLEQYARRFLRKTRAEIDRRAAFLSCA